MRSKTGTQHIEPFVHKADSCNGHSDKGHRYHYHALPKCLLENLGVPGPSNASYYYKNWHTLSVDEQIDLWPATGTPSPLIGYVTIVFENSTLLKSQNTFSNTDTQWTGFPSTVLTTRMEIYKSDRVRAQDLR